MVHSPTKPLRVLIVDDRGAAGRGRSPSTTQIQCPAECRGDAFVTLYGWWNRKLRTGYKCVRRWFGRYLARAFHGVERREPDR